MTPETKIDTAAKSTTPSRKDDQIRLMEAQLKEWDAQLALWSAKAEKAGTGLKAEFHKWQRDFADRREAAQKKLAAAQSSNQEAWEEVKTGMDAAWNEVKTAFENAKSKFS